MSTIMKYVCIGIAIIVCSFLGAIGFTIGNDLTERWLTLRRKRKAEKDPQPAEAE